MMAMAAGVPLRSLTSSAGGFGFGLGFWFGSGSRKNKFFLSLYSSPVVAGSPALSFHQPFPSSSSFSSQSSRRFFSTAAAPVENPPSQSPSPSHGEPSSSHTAAAAAPSDIVPPPSFAPIASVQEEQQQQEEEDNEKKIKEAAELLDIRVGHVLRAWRHPDADSLYVEEVDVGEPEPRTICSGLINFVTLDQLQGASVVVLANLKPRNMRGIKSNGMLMAASDAAHENVELLIPADGSVPGERIWFGSLEAKDTQPEAATPNQIQKKKLWEFVQPHLKTTDACVAVLCGTHPMRTSTGTVVCKSLKCANIS